MKPSLRSNPFLRTHVLGFAAVMMAFSCQISTAATATWNNTGTNFNTGANWTSGTGAGGIPGTGDVAQFTNAKAADPNLSASLTIQGLSFSSTASSGYTLSATAGQSLTLTNTGNGTLTRAVTAVNTSGINTISAPIILGGAVATTARFNQAGGGTLVLSGNISSTNVIDGIGFNSSSGSSAVFTLSGANTYSGTTTLAAQTLNINSSGALSSGNLISSNDSHLNNTSGAAVTVPNGLVLTTTLPPKTLFFDGLSAANNLRFNGAVDLSQTANNISVTNAGGTLTFGGTVNWGAVQTSKSGAGTWVLGGSNIGAGGSVSLNSVSYTSVVKLSAGVTEIGNAAAFGPTGAVELNGATLRSSGALTVTNPFVLSANSTLGGTNNLVLSGTISANNNGSRTLAVSNTGTTTLSGTLSISDLANSSQTFIADVASTAGTTEISGVIQNTTVAGSGVGSFTKTGSGLLKLSGNSTYTGATQITDGTLQLSGTGAINTTSSITINGSGAKFLQTSSVASTRPITLTNGKVDGVGSLGAVTVASAAGNTVAVGNGTSASLTLGSLTFSGAAATSFTLAGGATTTAPLIVTNNLTTSGGAASVVVNATALSPLVAGTTYKLIGYGTFSGNVADFTKGSFAGLSVRQLTFANDTIGKFITVSYSGAPDVPKWTGADDGTWQAGLNGTNKNWRLVTAATATDFIQGDDVRFDDSATGPTEINIPATVIPASTTFSNSTLDYSLSGASGIAGTGTLIKNGTALAAINTVNTYTGGTTLNAGVLGLNNASAIGTGPLTITGGVIDNTRADFSSVTLSTNNTQNWNGNFAFGGTSALNLGSGAVTLSANRVVTTDGSASLTVGGSINGAFSLTKEGAGTLVLSGLSTYTGGTIVNSGTLTLAAGGANGAVRGPLTVNPGAALSLTADDSLGTGAIGTSVSTLTLNNSNLNNTGTQGLVTNMVINGGVVSGGTFRFTTGFGISTPINSSTSLFDAAINIAGSSLVITTASGSDLSASRVISGTALTKSGAGLLTLAAANTYTGATLVSAGTLQIGDGFTGNIVSTSPVTVSSGATLGINLADAATLGNSISNAGTVNINGANINTLSGPIGGAGAFIQSGPGTTTLSGANTYTGATSATDGTLILAGSNTTGSLTINGTAAKVVSSIALSGPVTLTKGTFDGTGSVSSVAVAAGAANTVANGNGGTGTLTAGTLTFSGAGSLSLVPIGGASTTTAPLLVSGTFTTPVTANSITVNVAPASPLINGTYNLVGYGTFSGAAAAFKKGTGFSTRQTVSFGNNTTSKFITVTVTGDTPRWKGTDAGGEWKVGPTGANANWRLITAGTNTDYIEGDVVLFDDTATGTKAVDISVADVSPGLTTFNTATNNYTLSSSGGFGISGSGALIKNGAGKVTVTSTNTFTGSTTINGGTLQIGDGVTDGSIASTSGITNNGSLVYSLAALPKTVNKIISGTGSVTTTAAIDTLGLTLSGVNTFSGGVNINGGVLVATNASSLGAATNTLSFGAGGNGKLQLGGNSITLGGLNSDSTAIIENTVSGNPVLTINSSSDSQFGGVIQNGTGTVLLTKTGSSKLTLLGDNTYTGVTSVTGGTLQLGNGVSATGKLGDTTVNVSGGTLNLQTAAAITADRAVSFTGTGTLVETVDNAISGSARLNLGVPLTFTRPNNYSGQTTITAANVTLTTTNRLAFGTSLIFVQQQTSPVFQFHIDGGGTIAVPNSYEQNRMGGTPTTFDVNNNGTGANGVVQINGTTTLGDTGTETLNITGGNGYSLYLAAVRFGDYHTASVAFNPTSAVLKIGTYTGGAGNPSTVILNGTNIGNAIGNIVQPGGVVSVTKSGTSTWSLTGTNTYTGATLISAGTLQIGDGTTTGSLPASSAVTDNATLAFNRSNALTISNAISGTGSVSQLGVGTTTLSGANTYTGETSVTGGVLTIPTPFLSDSAAVRIGSAGTLDLTSGSTDTVSSLYINGVQQVAGTWGSLASAAANKTARITGTGLLNVTSGAVVTGSYASWATLKGLTAGVNDGATQDPDNDGIANALEFVLGGNPLASGQAILPVATLDATNFYFTFNRSDESEAEITTKFQYGSTLAGWIDVPIGAASAPADGQGVIVNVNEGAPTTNPDVITVTVPRTNAVAGKLFGRLVSVK